MTQFLTRVWNEITEITKTLSPARKTAIGAIGVISLLGILAISYLAGRPDYSLLFSGLEPQDSASITQNLTENGVKFRLAQEGTAILVPAEKVLELRLKLATAGLPSGGGVGFEIFDKSSFGMTEFVQKINLKRALQGELARTISQFKEIKAVRVHIAVPEKKLFSKDKEDAPTASVVIKIGSGKRLKKGQVRGIVHLVASSIENMTPENVTVVDTNGNVLSGGEVTDEAARLSATQHEYRSNVEAGIQKQITSMLENIVGPGKVVTRVSAVLDFRRVERTMKKYDPASQVARSEQRSESKSSGAQAPSGVPGVASNIPGGAGASLGGKPPTSTDTQETTNYEINETVSHVVEQVGTIKKISVAVLVDGKMVAKKGGEPGEKEFQARSPEEIKQLTDLIRSAAGIDFDRGDQIVVESAHFDTSRFEIGIEETNAEADRQFMVDVIKYAGMGALALIMFLFVVRPVLRWITSTSEEMENLRRFPQTVSQMETTLHGGKEEETDYRTKVSQMFSEDPQAGAELIREWLRARR
ncbi:Flagellar M-ring protein FliF [hydrothermal vent metagenome]|uniref:Flagellar M-ring protein FliF n=1 Tax=hydrothermal vent metagenome TaxID=652676 RepID=A0A3B1C889_9ZZZZ